MQGSMFSVALSHSEYPPLCREENHRLVRDSNYDVILVEQYCIQIIHKPLQHLITQKVIEKICVKTLSMYAYRYFLLLAPLKYQPDRCSIHQDK